MIISPNTKWSLTIPALVCLAGFIWACSSAFGGKADKAELAPIHEDISILKRDRAVDFAMQQSMLKLLEKMDARMERIENNQVWQIQESVKRWQGGNQPPASTPSPNPLSR